MERYEIEQIIADSINDLFTHDIVLLQNDVSERAITHKLAEYIQKRIPELNVDCEYNRDVTRGRRSPKSITVLKEATREELHKAADNIDTDEIISISTYPDIIVHRRGNNEENLLVVEVKKKNSSVSPKHDRQKLEAFTENNERNSYNFSYGVFIVLETDTEQPGKPALRWFRQGSEER